MRSLPLTCVLAAAIVLSACGEKEEPDLTDLPAPPPTTTTAAPGEPTTTTTTTAKPSAERASVLDTIRRYYVGLSLGKAGVVCRLLAPGAIDELELPRAGADCATALSRSIGYRDPSGPPAFRSAHPRRWKTQLREGGAKVVATVVTRYDNERRPSIDDDILYMRKAPAGWLILKPSAILYRAVGLEPPLSSLRPPPGF